MKTYRITNVGEANATIVKELTEEQYEFLNNLFEELNDNREPYGSCIYISEETPVNVEND